MVLENLVLLIKGELVGQKKGAQKGPTPKTIKINKCHIVIFVLFSTVGPASDVNDVPATAILDNTMQLDKLHAGQGGEVKRRKPSRDHIHRLNRDLDAEQQAEVGPLSFVKTSEMNITGTLPQAGNLKLFVPSLPTQSSTRPKQNIVLMRPDKTE